MCVCLAVDYAFEWVLYARCVCDLPLSGFCMRVFVCLMLPTITHSIVIFSVCVFVCTRCRI